MQNAILDTLKIEPMPSDNPPKMNATEQAYQIIRKDILTGKLAEGERLTETRGACSWPASAQAWR